MALPDRLAGQTAGAASPKAMVRMPAWPLSSSQYSCPGSATSWREMASSRNPESSFDYSL
jgi:hypothetical protein